MQPYDTVVSVLRAIEGIYRDNILTRAIYIEFEFHNL